jgi:hypothetical protein
MFACDAPRLADRSEIRKRGHHPKAILRNEVLEVRNVGGVVRIARKVRHHDEWDPAVEPCDP